MELKTKYQYSYFIYPYIIKENEYDKYILKLIKDKKYTIKFFDKKKDLDIYSYFLPAIREFMFQGFTYNKDKIRKFEEFSKEMQASLIAKEACTMFEYDLKQELHGKAGEEGGIFFKIQKIELICFNTGICFLLIKTNIEDSNEFSDVLNFNYKFRDINSDLKELKEYENIRLQTTTFSDIKKLDELIKEITGRKITTSKGLNINADRFLTYTYACIDQEDWNENKKFETIESEFFKYSNILPSSYKSNFDKKNMDILSKWEFIKVGFNKAGISMLASGIDTYNYVKLPYTYENEYLYTYILVQYQKMYLNKLEVEFKNESMGRDKFIKFTKNIWIQEITNDDIGTELYKKYKNVAETEKLYEKIKNKYDIVYKELNIEKESKINKIILIALGLSLLLNIFNLIALIKMM